MEGIAIKPITVDDVELLQAVALQAYKEYYLHLWYDGGAWYMEKCFNLQQLTEELQDNNARFFMVYADDDPLGFVKINVDAPFGDITNALELERIYFKRSAGGRGIGAYAVEYVFALAKSLNKQLVWLKVMDSSTKPIAFYKKMGFEICGTYHLPFEQMKAELRGMYIMKTALNEKL